MSLKSTDKNKRVYYFSEKPSDNGYPNSESFYFRLVDYEINDRTNEIEFVIIQIVSFVFEDCKLDNIRFKSPYIHESIKLAVRTNEKL